ncbi:MAG TPA: SusD/RagB family nutrient-binding outer membrane lipoprotein [Flavitalea sp.]|nr:SusD/RagB family nutrient-binding outer membrane lipoprotein [Flavitalea sp.]
MSRLIILASICLIITGCTKNFGEINTDPNRPKTITPGVMLGQLQYRMVNTTISAAKNFTHQLMQVDAPRSSPGGGGLHRYVVNTDAGIWNSMYGYLTDVEDIYYMADSLNEPNYKGIALLYKTWAYSILTDLYGDVPYSQATQAVKGIFQPGFDKQQDIYAQLLKNLDTVNSILHTGAALRYGGDLVYNANALSSSTNPGIVKWKKFANSLKLRLLLRSSKRDGELNISQQINEILSNPESRPVFTSTADDAILRYPGSFPYFNPYYNARQLDWREGSYFTEFFMNKLNEDEDPRRAIWSFQVMVDGVSMYSGIQSGYPTTVEYQVGKNSSYNDALKTLPQLGVMMTYAEVEFIKAELALKSFQTGKTAREHYENGIRASMTQWGAALPDGFLAKPGILYNESGSGDEQLAQIMLQKYYAYLFVDYQSWFEKNRTGYPELPRGAGIPAENQFPTRAMYPSYLQSLNAEQLKNATESMGGDLQTTKLWWQK